MGLLIPLLVVAAAAFPQASVEYTRSANGCDQLAGKLENWAIYEELGDGRKLMHVPCMTGAYNALHLFFVVDAAGGAQALSFYEWTATGLGTTQIITNPSFDPKTKLLTSFAKGRGVGDCGSWGVWWWDGVKFKLRNYWRKDDCDGQLFAPEEKWRVFPPKQ